MLGLHTSAFFSYDLCLSAHPQIPTLSSPQQVFPPCLARSRGVVAVGVRRHHNCIA